jgi:hypothetical protein
MNDILFKAFVVYLHTNGVALRWFADFQYFCVSNHLLSDMVLTIFDFEKNNPFQMFDDCEVENEHLWREMSPKWENFKNNR